MNNLAVHWFEISVYNFDRAKAFYETIFDIKLSIIDLGAVTMAMFPGGPGALCHGEWYKPSPDGVVLHLSVGDDLGAVLDRVERAGGQVLQAKKQISPELGFMGLLLDSEGNRLALRSPK
ncbi:MAG: VOC family protein [Cytophagales bacterium]|nr:MAG: VOC family protein [Cytophagales bacterium]